jgi:DNA-binding response OmpR family regulator
LEYRSILHQHNASPSVLVVEDDWDIAEELADALRFKNFDVIGPVASVAEAFSAIDRRVPDLAVLDLRLAGETSAPIACYLEKRGIPFVFLTGSPNETKAEFPSAPVLVKPVRLAALIATLDLVALKCAA